VGEPVNLCEELLAILLGNGRKQGQRADLGRIPIGINREDIHDGIGALVLQHRPRMGGSLLDEDATLSEQLFKCCRGRSIQAPMHARCHLLELGLGIRVVRQKAEEQMAHQSVARMHLLMGLLQVLEPGIGRLSQLYPAFRRDE